MKTPGHIAKRQVSSVTQLSEQLVLTLALMNALPGLLMQVNTFSSSCFLAIHVVCRIKMATLHLAADWLAQACIHSLQCQIKLQKYGADAKLEAGARHR